MARLIEAFGLQVLPLSSLKAHDNHKRALNKKQIG
jgi:hypothetical protein